MNSIGMFDFLEAVLRGLSFVVDLAAVLNDPKVPDWAKGLVIVVLMLVCGATFYVLSL